MKILELNEEAKKLLADVKVIEPKNQQLVDCLQQAYKAWIENKEKTKIHFDLYITIETRIQAQIGKETIYSFFKNSRYKLSEVKYINFSGMNYLATPGGNIYWNVRYSGKDGECYIKEKING